MGRHCCCLNRGVRAFPALDPWKRSGHAAVPLPVNSCDRQQGVSICPEKRGLVPLLSLSPAAGGLTRGAARGPLSPGLAPLERGGSPITLWVIAWAVGGPLRGTSVPSWLEVLKGGRESAVTPGTPGVRPAPSGGPSPGCASAVFPPLRRDGWSEQPSCGSFDSLQSELTCPDDCHSRRSGS